MGGLGGVDEPPTETFWKRPPGGPAGPRGLEMKLPLGPSDGSLEVLSGLRGCHLCSPLTGLAAPGVLAGPLERG